MNKLVPDYARGKDTQENPSFKHAEGRLFFRRTRPRSRRGYSRDSPLFLSRIKPARSQRRGVRKTKKKFAKVFALFGYVSIFPRFLFLARGKSDGSLLLYKGSTPFVALKTEFRQISVPRIFRRGKTLLARAWRRRRRRRTRYYIERRSYRGHFFLSA